MEGRLIDMKKLFIEALKEGKGQEFISEHYQMMEK